MVDNNNNRNKNSRAKLMRVMISVTATLFWILGKVGSLILTAWIQTARYYR